MRTEQKKIQRLAIANRGEVAVRIIKACQELGIETVLLHSEVDVQSRAYRMATKTICIGGASTAESYLNIRANIHGALAGGAQAIHPGFGFLSENADFAEACVQAGLIFVGPSPESIRALGDKVNCKELAKVLGIPLVPGYEGENQEVVFLVAQAEKIGFPVIVKAAAGGGGRGMKLINSLEEAKELIESAQRESQAAFGSSKVFLEKYLDRAKHIEFQIFADSIGQVIHLMDRECSVQRRHQKIIEEALSPSLTHAIRSRMAECAVNIAKKANYKGAGTVEFLFQDNEFYLLEVNTRLQVEHPVTEEVMGIDLVKAQILTAQNDFVLTQDRYRTAHGHSIECRVYAENSYLGGMPSTGVLGTVSFPEGPGRRFEYGFEKNDTITAHYDPMIAKVIVWDETREKAIKKMQQVLSETVIFGVHTNIPYLQAILSHPEFILGKMTTRFIETYFKDPIKVRELSSMELKMIEQIKKEMTHLKPTGANENPWSSYWRGL
ncbi:MAG: ATP-grasp domain-containing protein [Bdellovibrionaceae bacterium]|nr:ATP-grasp domain-containing protein [Pseudobdellovibrionaceae bacterium]